MGKKKMDVMQQQKLIFREGCEKHNQIPADKADEIFDIMMKFAEYGFNRSHSAAYSLVAFQTAYLKANYPAEYMASVLTHNMNDIKKVTFFMEECKRLKIPVLGPDVNESQLNFTVNSKGQIRFGLSAIKGVGEVPVEKLLETRREGAFATIADFVRRVPPQVANKKCLESFAYSGALDCFGLERVQYFTPTEKEATFVDALNRYNSVFHKQQKDTSASLFGEESLTDLIEDPIAPKISKRWSLIEQLKYEKDVVGIFISGHPLNDYELEYRRFATPIADLESTGRYEVRLPVSLDDLAFIKSQQDGTVALHAEIGGQKMTWTGTVVRTEGEVERASRSVYLVAELAEDNSPQDAFLKPGLFLRAQVEGRVIPDVFEIPSLAFLDESHLRVVTKDDKLFNREVKVTRRTATTMLVSEGLQQGDRVCLTSIPAAIDGMQVKVTETTGAAPAGTQPAP